MGVMQLNWKFKSAFIVDQKKTFYETVKRTKNERAGHITKNHVSSCIFFFLVGSFNFSHLPHSIHFVI